jgi:hypothetical protein
MATVSKWVVRVLLVAAIALVIYGAVSADWSIVSLGLKAAGAWLLWHWAEPIIQRQRKGSEQPVDK